jgi:hypothetical protein
MNDEMVVKLSYPAGADPEKACYEQFGVKPLRVIHRDLPSLSADYRLATVRLPGTGDPAAKNTYTYRVSVSQEYEVVVFAATEAEADDITQTIDVEAEGRPVYDPEEDWSLESTTQPGHKANRTKATA